MTIDLLAFDSEELYFDEAIDEEAKSCLDRASEEYGTQAAEGTLLRAYFLEPEHPMVLVALYRFYYYQHRLKESLLVAERVLKVIGRRLEFPEDWRDLTELRIGSGVMISMTMLRFYMLALKGAGYLELRLGRYESALERLEKVAELDAKDRLGAQALLTVVRNALSQESGVVTH
jgi:tetratricopeptide (TPR) repeat protein